MKVFVLTGAGVSAESGLGTFRDPDGLWARFDPMRLATPEAFAANPDLVHAFYNARRQNCLNSQPNEAHRALAHLEAGLSERGGSLFLCTQNVDDLHERAGTHRIVHMHGSLLEARCTHCRVEHRWHEDLGTDSTCPSCGTVGCLRPNIVWFGEVPMHLIEIERTLLDADLFVSIGTSGSVYPAAGFVSMARAAGTRTCEVNLEPSEGADAFHERHYGVASKVVPDFIENLLSGQTA